MDHQYLILISSADVFGKMEPESGNEDLFKRSETPIASIHGLFGSLLCEYSPF